MRFIGLDLHKKTLVVCALDRRGKVLFRESVECRREALEAFARTKLRKTDRLAVEATTNTWAVADLLRPYVAAVTVGNPLQIKAIAQAKVKTDKIDAEVLAHLLRCEYLPTVWTPDAATQQLRQLTTLRGGVIADRTRIKNRVQSLLAQLLVVPPVKVLFTNKGVEWLRAVELPAEVRSAVDLYLRLYDAVDAELRKIDDRLMALAYEDGRAKLLMTLPGVAHGVAVSLLAALGDTSRFPDGDHAASYLGLTPRLRQSATKRHYGGITKAGCPQTRAMLVQAVQAASDHPGPIGAFFRRLRKRKKYNVAVIATARKLVTVAYLMLKNNEPYRYAKQTGWWMIEIDGKQEKLVEGPKDEHHRILAEEKFVELRRLRRLNPEAVISRTADVVEAFLHHSRVHFATDTHRMNKYYCQLFAEDCGQVPARELKPYHVDRWIDPKVEADEWGVTTVYNARKAAMRVFFWAAERKLLTENPLKGMKNPKPPPRQRAITEAEFWKMYENAGGPLRDLLLALYLTGARPKEVRELRWENVRDDRWLLPEHKTAKKTGRPRHIYLDATIRDMMGRLKGNGHTHVFLNTEGRPWTRNALRLQVWRIKKKLGLASDVCAYLCRHGFGTRAILNGVDGRTLAELMGHTSQEMISKVYVHLADQHQHLKAAVDKVNGSAVAPPADLLTTRKRAKSVKAEAE